MQGLNSFSEIVYASRVNALIKQSGDLIEAHHLNHVNHLSSKRRHISTLGIQRRYFKDGSKKSAINGIIKCQPENTTDKAAFGLNTKSEDQLHIKKKWTGCSQSILKYGNNKILNIHWPTELYKFYAPLRSCKTMQLLCTA